MAPRRAWSRAIALACCQIALLALGCGSTQAPPDAPAGITLTGPWQAGGTLPTRYTCVGEGLRPLLRWSGAPAGARELAIVVSDPDAPGGRFIHWTAWGIPPRAHAVPRGVPQGTPWKPPCPPMGDKPHRYIFEIYALGKPSGLKAGAGYDTVIAALKGALAHGQLVGRFGR